LGDGVVGDEDVGPNGAQEFVAVDQPSRVLDKVAQQRERFRAQGDFRPVHRQQQATGEVGGEASKLKTASAASACMGPVLPAT
jgi:hypothetical protein